MNEKNTEWAMSMSEYYDGKKFCVVGGAGFVGSHLVEGLLLSGAEVYVIDNFSRGRNIFHEAEYLIRTQLGSYMSHQWAGGDWILANPLELDYGGADVSCGRPYFAYLDKMDGVFNLAATVAGVIFNQSHHNKMYSENIALLAGPLLACEQAGVKNYMQTSSVCVYAEEYQSPCVEENGFLGVPHEANAGYAEAKRDGERMVSWSSIERAMIARPSNVIGPRDYYDNMAHVLPAFIKRAYQPGDNFILYGDPNIIREFIYVEDVAIGMMNVMRYGTNKWSYNIGTSGRTKVSIFELADMVLRMTGNQHKKILLNTEVTSGGDIERFSDCSRAETELGWKSVTGLEEAVAYTIIDYLMYGRTTTSSRRIYV